MKSIVKFLPGLIVLFTTMTPGCDGTLDSTHHDSDNQNCGDHCLDLPQRSDEDLTGSNLISVLSPLSLQARETKILNEILSGNVPDFLRSLVPVTVSKTIGDTTYTLTYYVTADYMALGSDTDYVLMPMTPILAQKLADALDMSLITRKMVNDIWQRAELKLTPRPIAPSDTMDTVPVFADHNDTVWSQRQTALEDHPWGDLVAGHKKDVILSNRIASQPDKVVIYGWHRLNGVPIQPLYSGHAIWYADYSHGIRLVEAECTLNGQTWKIADILQDPQLYRLLSDEDGPMTVVRYATDQALYP